MISKSETSKQKLRLSRHWLTLERKVLMLAGASMLLILAASFYLHSVRTRAVVRVSISSCGIA